MRPRTVIVSALVAALAGCGGGDGTGPEVSPTPSGTATLPGTTLGPASGGVAIALLAASPAPGSTISGCGASVAGCTSRVRMTFQLTPSASGSVLFCTAFLHTENQTACLQGRTPPQILRAGQPQTVDVVFDQADAVDRCRPPFEITHLAFTVEGTVNGRQEWGLRYRIGP